MKLHKLLAFLLTLVMVLPMALPVLQVGAEETVTELPTETIPVDTTTEESADPVFYQCNFLDETQLADFDLYQSGTSKFVVSDGVLVADGTDGEQKAILNKDVSSIKSVSVNIIPGESGVIYGGVYFGAKDAQAGQDQINSQVILIKSDYSGWSDAANRIDIVHGQFNNSWTHISTTISETGRGNALFSGGTKQPLNLRLDFSEDVVLLTLSLVSNSAKYVQVMYEIEPEDLQGQIGLRSIGSDTKYDKLAVNEKYKPATLTQGLVVDGTGTTSYGKTVGGMTQKPVTIEAWFKMASFSNGSRRQAIVSNHTESGLAKNSQTWGLYTNEYGTLYYTERSELGEFNSTLGIKVWKNEWMHLVLVRGDGVLKVYLNGELAKTVESTKIGATTSKESSLTFGYCTVGGSTGINAMKGEIGDIRLWSTERTQAQIQDTMYQELTNTEEGLLHHWAFDEQSEGISKDGVTGGLDCELIGHTQIGNQTIHRWDFSNTAQLDDFTNYTSGTATYVVQDGVLYTSGGGEGTGADVKAVLNQKYDNIKTVSVEMTGAGSYRCWGGFVLGVTEVYSSAESDYEGVCISMGGLRTSSARRPWSEIYAQKISAGTATTLGTNQTHTTFYPGSTAADKLATHLKLEISGGTVNSSMYRIDDPTVNLSHSFTTTEDVLDGLIGLRSGNSRLNYDNFTIVCEEPVVEDEVIDTVSYQNEGYNFFNSGSKAWEMKQDITTPYTLEAWVKVPEGIADSTVGYIAGNSYRAPCISMRMSTEGNLSLAWGVENADLTKSTTYYDVDTDLRNGKWTHVAYTCDVENDIVVAYINGKAVKTWTDAGLQEIILPDHVSPANWFMVGSNKTNMGASSNLFPGWIADVRLWDNVLSAEQIQASMMTQYTTAKDGLLFNAPLNEIVDDSFTDLSGNGNHLSKSVEGFQLETQEHEPGAYSMVVIPDQQILSHYYHEELLGMYQWIADNREKENIQIVMNVGDMADNCGNTTQWQISRDAVDLLPDDLPFIAVPGNHDYDTNSGWNKGYGVRDQLTLMNQYMPQSMFEAYPTEIGFLDETNSANQWQAFEVNGNKYLVLALEYVPREDSVQWANEVIQSHPNHQVILITHSYVGSYGNLDRPYLWNDLLSKHENVIMAFSGHVWHTNVVHRTDKGVNGNNVHNILMDAQGMDTGNRKYAMVGILRFNADGTLCDISYYSTSRDQYEARSNFTVEIAKQENKYAALVGLESYESVTEAAANANGQIVEILKDTDEAITISTDVTIDLAGYTLSNVTVADGASLTLIDTATDDYTGQYGAATVTGNVKTFSEVNGKTYMTVDENGVYSAHCYDVALTHISLKPVEDALGYKAKLYGDEVVQKYVTGIGFNLWLDGLNAKTCTTTGKQEVTLRLKNILKCGGGELNINATAFVTLAVGEQTTTKTSTQNTTTMRQTLQIVDTAWSAYGETQQNAVKALCVQYFDTVKVWELPNILEALKPVATVEEIAVVDQAMTVYGSSMAGTFTLTGATTFTTQDTAETVAQSPYVNWIADYYITMDAEAVDGLYLAGNYGTYGWIAIPVEAGQTYTAVPVVATLLSTSLTYEEMVIQVGTFSCGIADTLGNNSGATVTVELRLTNPENAADYITLNVIEHTIPAVEDTITETEETTSAA